MQFDFVNPGAKSLSMAGAFAGLADDATATFANPAGLTQLGGSEVSIELRGVRVDAPFLAGGRLSGTPVGIGLDTVAQPIFSTSTNSHLGPGFVAGLYMHPSHRWVIAGYRHELVRIDQSFFSEGVFQKDPGELTSQRDRPQDAHREISITSYGASGSFAVRPNVSVGASLSLYRLAMDSAFIRYLPGGGFTNPADRTIVDGRATQGGRDTALTPTVGILVGRNRLKLGAHYRRGPSFRYTTQERSSPVRQPTFRVPDTWALGASIRPRPQLTLAGEVTYLTYSRLQDDFIADQALSAGRADSFFVEDGVELRVGAQYAFPRAKGRPRLRAGSWYEPDHSVRFRPSEGPTLPVDRLFDERMVSALSRGGRRVHVTGGLGLTLSPHVELNIGADHATNTSRISTSLIIR